jgi:hypothetical protein
MKKTLFTLSVDNYAPEITAITFPMLKRYADKIGAEFFVIKERRYPDFPPVYEKLQIYDLGKENDWNIFVDADTMLRVDLPDVTALVPKDTVLFHGKDFASSRWKYDGYFMRDGRHIGACNWFAVASNWCLDLWHPLDIPLSNAVENITLVPAEEKTVVTNDHLIDDYTLSRNIARYGLKHQTIESIMASYNLRSADYLWHDYLISVDEKVQWMLKIKKAWGLK